MEFPEGKKFAFTVFDDTDFATVENVGPVYRLLRDLGFRTTKSVWPLSPTERAAIGGSSLQDRDYLQFIRWLQSEGFEIGLHNVRSGDSTRDTVIKGMNEFGILLQATPKTYCQHVSNRENLYWGAERLRNPALRSLYTLATRGQRRGKYEGSRPGSPYFWGDICRDNIEYVRNLVFDEVNLLKVNPSLPYHDAAKPYVKYWFSSSEGADVASFTRMLADENQERLEMEGGVCIMYTHFANGFVRDGHVHSAFQHQLEKLSERDGWFVPVSTLLDHLRTKRPISEISRSEQVKMEARWLFTKLRHGTT